MIENDSSTLIGLVSRYSPSGSEQQAVKYLVNRMKELGYNNAFIDQAGNAVGVIGNGPRQIILLGHIDTVPGEIPVGVIDGNLYGRGTVDAKGALSCFVDAAARVGAIDGWQFIVIGAVEEEQGSSGARHVASIYQPEYAVIGEPNRWDRIALGYKGSARAQVTIHRPQVHTANGEPSACEMAIQAWLAIKAFVESFNSGRQRSFDTILPNLSALESGQDGFEQWARLKFEARLPIGFSPDEWYARLAEIFVLPDPFVVSLEFSGYPVPAWSCEKNTRIVRAFINGIRDQGGTPSFVYKTGTSDLNIVAPIWQCPSLVYGPGNSALDHTPNEHLSLEEYNQALLVLEFALQWITKA